MSAGHILQRLLLVIPTLFGVAVVIFVLLRVVPGNPIAMMTPPGASAADIEQLKALYGFDKSIAEQFGIWLSGVLQGDLGTSISLRQSVVELILGRLPATLELCLLASLMAAFLCLLFALVGSYRPRGIVSRLVDLLASIIQAVPDFLWGVAIYPVAGCRLAIVPHIGAD